MKKTYLTIWPDGTHTIARADSLEALYFILDQQGSPESGTIYELPRNWISLTHDQREGCCGFFVNIPNGDCLPGEDLNAVIFEGGKTRVIAPLA